MDSLLVGPVPVGLNKFIFEADPPSPDLIPASELVSVTVVILSCSYNDQEFVRVGYYVNNEYDSPELRENPPTKVQVDHVTRNILAEKPRVTKFSIAWDGDQPADNYPPEQPDVDLEEDDEDQYGEEEQPMEEEYDDDEGEDELEDAQKKSGDPDANTTTTTNNNNNNTNETGQEQDGEDEELGDEEDDDKDKAADLEADAAEEESTSNKQQQSEKENDTNKD